MSTGMIAGTVLGMASQKQGEVAGQNKMFAEEQSEKRMADYYYKLGMQKWKDTGFGAQADQLRDAGLSVGMMYGGAGAGGQTSDIKTSARNVESGNQLGAVGMQIGSQLALTKAQTDNVKAQTEKAKAETQATQTETDYRNKGVEPDGISGNQVRYQQEMAQMYKTVEERDKIEKEIEQMPQELANKTREVVIKAGELQNNIHNAETNEEKIKLENEIQAKRVEIEKFRAELEAQYPGQDKVVGKMLNNIVDDFDRLTDMKEKRESRRRKVETNK